MLPIKPKILGKWPPAGWDSLPRKPLWKTGVKESPDPARPVARVWRGAEGSCPPGSRLSLWWSRASSPPRLLEMCLKGEIRRISVSPPQWTSYSAWSWGAKPQACWAPECGCHRCEHNPCCPCRSPRKIWWRGPTPPTRDDERWTPWEGQSPCSKTDSWALTGRRTWRPCFVLNSQRNKTVDKHTFVARFPGGSSMRISVGSRLPERDSSRGTSKWPSRVVYRCSPPLSEFRSQATLLRWVEPV